MESIEVIGETVEEAIATGMAELGVDSPSQVMVEVIQEPDQGIMGEGARPAKVRLLFMGTRPDEKVTSIVNNQVPEQQDLTPIVAKPYVAEPEPDDRLIAFEDAPEDAQVGQQILYELLEKMDIEGKVVIREATAVDASEGTQWILNITGKNMNRLIGRRGETLSSMQYITRLIASRRLQRRANIIVDAGDYKAKRSDRLKSLANRMADQAVRQHRTVTLEPMPPHERRIIHLTLRKRSDVSTRSVGEGQSRKVTINPE